MKKKWLSWYSDNRLLMYMYIVEGTYRFHNLLLSKQTLYLFGHCTYPQFFAYISASYIVYGM